MIEFLCVTFVMENILTVTTDVTMLRLISCHDCGLMLEYKLLRARTQDAAAVGIIVLMQAGKSWIRLFSRS